MRGRAGGAIMARAPLPRRRRTPTTFLSPAALLLLIFFICGEGFTFVTSRRTTPPSINAAAHERRLPYDSNVDLVTMLEVGQEGEGEAAPAGEGGGDAAGLADELLPPPVPKGSPGTWTTDDFTPEMVSEMEQIFVDNISLAMDYINVTGNVNATMKPVTTCPNECFQRGECLPIPSPSPSASVVPGGLSAVLPKPDDPDEAARILSEELAKDTLRNLSPSPSPLVEPSPVPEGVSPSVTPLPGQINGPLLEDMIPGAPPGSPGGPALPFEKRVVPGMCKCSYGFYGPSCEYEYCYPSLQCNGRGVCRNTSNPYNDDDDPPIYCECEDGWRGDNCEFQENRCGVLAETAMQREIVTNKAWKAQPDRFAEGLDCSGHGTCDDGVCICEDRWEGTFCDRALCPLDCSGHGECDHVTGDCTCDVPFFGKACSLAFCESDCSGHGVCDRYMGQCDCDAMWYGDICDQAVCPHDCSGHGECDNTDGTCRCEPRFKGLDCSQFECPLNCHGGHTCLNGTCFCDPGWKGRTCNVSLCTGMCLDLVHGQCDKLTARCSCLDGWVGAQCDIDDRCPKWRDPWDGTIHDCTANGECIDGKCVCNEGYRGFDCSKMFYECGSGYVCEHGGKCVSGRCECVPPFKGFDCSLQMPQMCNLNEHCLHGDCIDGICHCHAKWSGDWCTIYNQPEPYSDTRVRQQQATSTMDDDEDVTAVDVVPDTQRFSGGGGAGNGTNGTNGKDDSANVFNGSAADNSTGERVSSDVFSEEDSSPATVAGANAKASRKTVNFNALQQQQGHGRNPADQVKHQQRTKSPHSKKDTKAPQQLSHHQHNRKGGSGDSPGASGGGSSSGPKRARNGGIADHHGDIVYRGGVVKLVQQSDAAGAKRHGGWALFMPMLAVAASLLMGSTLVL